MLHPLKRAVFYDWISKRLRGNSCKREMHDSAEGIWKQKWEQAFKEEAIHIVLGKSF